MSPKINETCKNYLEKEIPEKYYFFLKVYLNTQKGPFGYSARSYLTISQHDILSTQPGES